MMPAFVVRTTVYSDGHPPIATDYAVLATDVRDALVAIARDRPVGVLIERTDRVLSSGDAAALGLQEGMPKPMP